MIKTDKSVEDIDIEWLQLILEAKEIGIPIEEIRTYLQQNQTHQNGS